MALTVLTEAGWRDIAQLRQTWHAICRHSDSTGDSTGKVTFVRAIAREPRLLDLFTEMLMHETGDLLVEALDMVPRERSQGRRRVA